MKQAGVGFDRQIPRRVQMWSSRVSDSNHLRVPPGLDVKLRLEAPIVDSIVEMDSRIQVWVTNDTVSLCAAPRHRFATQNIDCGAVRLESHRLGRFVPSNRISTRTPWLSIQTRCWLKQPRISGDHIPQAARAASGVRLEAWLYVESPRTPGAPRGRSKHRSQERRRQGETQWSSVHHPDYRRV
jgi:hypothetical protein